MLKLLILLSTDASLYCDTIDIMDGACFVPSLIFLGRENFVVFVNLLYPQIINRSETIRVNAILCIVFECIAIYCHIAIFDWILVKRHFIWEYGFWQ